MSVEVLRVKSAYVRGTDTLLGVRLGELRLLVKHADEAEMSDKAEVHLEDVRDHYLYRDASVAGKMLLREEEWVE